MNIYGGPICACCGETNLFFLTFDHINGGGRKHILEIGHPNLGGWLRRNNYPDGYRVLCANCNSGRAMVGGVCPHQVYYSCVDTQNYSK